MAISRSRDRAELVTDDARELADQLEKATVERVAALDGVALQAAHETVFGAGNSAERGRDALSERGRGPGAGYNTGRDRAGNLPEPGAGRHEGGRDSGRSGHWRGRWHGPEREAATEKSMEPAPKPVELDLGM